MHLLKLDRRWNVKHAGHRHRDPSPLPVPLPAPAGCRRQGRAGKAGRRKEGARRLGRLKVPGLGKEQPLPPTCGFVPGGQTRLHPEKKSWG